MVIGNNQPKDFDKIWEELRFSYNKTSPKRLYSYNISILEQILHDWQSLEDFHPVMTLRTLITNIYNPIRITRFARIIKEYFPQTYYRDKKIKKILNELMDFSENDNFLLQWTAYFIILVFSYTASPKNRQDQIKSDYLQDLLEKIISISSQDIKKIYSDNDNTILNIFDQENQNVDELRTNKHKDLPLFPIPGGDFKFFQIFQNICRKTSPPEDLYERLKNFKQTKRIHRKGGLNEFDTKNFMPEILPRDFIELFMDSNYESLQQNLPSRLFNKFKNIDKIYKFLLNQFFLSNYEEINYYEFQNLCKKHHLSWSLIEKNILSVSDLEEGRRKLVLLPYDHYRDLYRKPLLWVKSESGKQYKYNHIVFSWPILFDAYLANIATFWKNSYVGKKRGKKLEDSVAILVQNYLFADPFKLIIINKSLPDSDPGIKRVLNQTADFKFNRIIIKIDPLESGHESFNYREYDICYYYNERIYFVETKDNIFLDTFDHPDLSLKWLLTNLRLIRIKEKLLKKPVIKAELERALNLPIQNSKGMFVSNISFNIHRCFSIGEFQNYLAKLQNQLKFDLVRQNTMQILRAKIRQGEILRDINMQSQFLNKAFNLAVACGLWEDVVEFGIKILDKIEQTKFYEDKLLVCIKLADAYFHLNNFSEAIKVLKKTRYNINLLAEPELGAYYFFKLGQSLKEMGAKEEALGAYLESERILRKIEIEEDYNIVLIAQIYLLYEGNQIQQAYYTRKLLSYFPNEEDIDTFAHSLVQNMKNN